MAVCVCVLYCLTLVVVTAVALCECRRWLSERKERKSTSAANEEAERERELGVLGRRFVVWGLAILCVCLSARTIVDGLVPVGYWNGRQEKFVRYECRDRWKVDSPTMGEFE
jgi:ABC-type Fe3+ transport system permease subunit